MRSRSYLAISTATLLTALAPAFAAPLTTIALSTDKVSNATLGFVNAPVLNNNGQIAFQGGGGLLLFNQGANQFVVRDNLTTVPGTTDKIGFIYDATLADTGDIALQINTTKTGNPEAYLIAKHDASLDTILVAGQSAAPLIGSSLTVSSIATHYFSNNGTLGFGAIFSDSGINNDIGLFTATNASDYTLIARTGLTPPGRTGIWTAAGNGFPGAPKIDPTGTPAFIGVDSPTGTSSGLSGAVFVGTSLSSLSIPFAAGSVVPRTGGKKIQTIAQLSVNALHHTVAYITVAGASPAATAVLTNRNGSLETLAISGDTAPGLPGLVFGSRLGLNYQPLINARDQIAFGSNLVTSLGSADADQAIFAETDAGIQLVSHLGEIAPGAPAATTFTNIGDAYEFNALDQILFSADLSNGTHGIYLWNPDDSTVPIATTGDQLTLVPGTTKTVSTLSFVGVATGGGDGSDRALNDSGQVVFQAQFTDGSTAILAYGVPEPASLALLAASLPLLLPRRRTSRRQRPRA